MTIEKNDKKPLSGYHFVIDPGHGGKDSGTKGANILEKTLTLSTAKKVAEKLHQKGATVTMTRTDDRFISLAKRVQISNVNQTDAFISLHFNSYTNSNISGLNTFYYSGGQDAQFAKTLQSALIRHTELVDRGAKKANYYVLRNNKDLAVLIELGFLSNPDDRKKVQTETYQQQVAEGITSGLEDYFK
ncbi:N-acetylmuramoyl-L-alanine amidase [Virgibacillus sp. 179-BFC.A HS]|uniref:N-acetylmuramoyl-L-alanine amidase n=1 Tax=Tigheibacillus jepli TaxID=3035914 RepID=A0ABU5CCN7_9BACI|nr:N-acetylmuramoyl-L-alanine amidase [Virgibacillus sp. 179-BFC.A HS]MDY0404083.1 N-acetylmuramoyl-L-alanine amidase [Virgibacillus sp. 179-BFC.A HS]